MNLPGIEHAPPLIECGHSTIEPWNLYIILVTRACIHGYLAYTQQHTTTHNTLFWAQMALASLVPFQGPKKSRFSGPTPSNAPRNDVPPLKIITYRAIKTTGTLIVNMFLYVYFTDAGQCSGYVLSSVGEPKIFLSAPAPAPQSCKSESSSSFGSGLGPGSG